MRSVTSPPRGFPVIALAGALLIGLVVAACGSTTTSSGGGGGGSATMTATTGATVAATVTANTALCNTMTLQAVGNVVGGTVTILEKGAFTKGTETAVNCTFLPNPASGQRIAGEISYLFSQNGPAAYAANRADDSSRAETETTLSGLGDAAFWAVSARNPGTLQLSVLKGNVLLIMTLLGTNPNGSSMLNGAIGLARGALPSM